MSDEHVKRYNAVAVVLHWLMAIGFFMMLGSGAAMGYLELPQDFKFKLYQWHKSGGVILLLAFFVRIGWRFASRIPALPAVFSAFDMRLAKLGHWALYGLMVAMPVSGWVMVSSSVYGLPTIVFGWFEWPHIPGISGNKEIQSLAKDAHFYLAIALGLTIAAHIAAVVKHAVKDKVNLLPRMWFGVLLLAFLPFPAQAAEYLVDREQSRITFSGTHAGNAFEGVFEGWSAEIAFDPDDLGASQVSAVFDLSSAKTGSKLYDGTLPQADWFDVENHPEARFDSTAITRNEDGSYTAVGKLSLRGVASPVQFDFTLSDLGVQPVIAVASFEIDRFVYGIGMKSDPEAEWVGQMIGVELSLSVSEVAVLR